MADKTLRACRVHDEKAYFHKWTEVAQVNPPSNLIGGHSGGQLSQPFGIVEFANGKVELVSPEEIQFTDNPQDYVATNDEAVRNKDAASQRNTNK